MKAFGYPVKIERDQDGAFVIVVPDLDDAATGADTLDEALAEAQDLIESVLFFRMQDGEDIPLRRAAGSGQIVVHPSAVVAAKAMLYQATREFGSVAEAAMAIGWRRQELSRAIRPDSGTKVQALEDALHRLGYHTAMAFESPGTGDLRTVESRVSEPE